MLAGLICHWRDSSSHSRLFNGLLVLVVVELVEQAAEAEATVIGILGCFGVVVLRIILSIVVLCRRLLGIIVVVLILIFVVIASG